MASEGAVDRSVSAQAAGAPGRVPQTSLSRSRCSAGAGMCPKAALGDSRSPIFNVGPGAKEVS